MCPFIMVDFLLDDMIECYSLNSIFRGGNIKCAKITKFNWCVPKKSDASVIFILGKEYFDHFYSLTKLCELF